MSSGDNIFERRVGALAVIAKRRMEFAQDFFGVGERPPFTKKLNRTEQREYFWSLPMEKQVDMWAKLDANERDVVLGTQKATGEQKARELMGYGH